MFDLEHAIAEWRRQMQAAGLEAPDSLDELENHLRDEIGQQTRSGSPPEQSFQSAVRQLGTPQALQAEFAKAEDPSPARFRRRAAVAYGVEILAYTVLQMRFLWKSAPAPAELCLAIAGLAVTLFAACAGWRLVPRLMSVISNQTVRGSVAIAGTLSTVGWMAIYACFVLPRFDFTPGQFAAAFLWALLPMVTAPTLLTGINPPESNIR